MIHTIHYFALSVHKTTALVAALGSELYVPAKNGQNSRKMVLLLKHFGFFIYKICFKTALLVQTALKWYKNGQISFL